MPEKTDLNIAPYFDDYDESKKYHKILFKAGRPLQARELTQSQSILQNQIERFGNHIFKNGSIVDGIRTDIDLELYYVKVSTENPNTAGDADVETYRETFHGKFLQGKTSGVIAKVKKSTPKETVNNQTDEMTLFLKYVVNGLENRMTFIQGEELQEVTVNAAGVYSIVGTNNNEFKVLTTGDTSKPTGQGSAIDLDEGVIYLRGFFVKVDAQSLILEKYSVQPTYKIGLNIEEKLISNAEDATLQDNATGASNQNAAGADRLQLDLTLKKYPVDSIEDSNFVELARVEKGNIAVQITDPTYNVLEKSMARRTHDASGDFVLKNFEYELKEHLDDETNNGMFKKDVGGDETKFVMQMSPGKAYVQGFEVAKTGAETVPFPKARTIVSEEDMLTTANVGNIIRVTNCHGLPEITKGINATNIEAHKLCKLWNMGSDHMTSDSHASDGPIANNREPETGDQNSPEQIGYARLRDITHHTGSSTAGEYNEDTTEFNLSAFDIKMFTKISYSAHTGTAQTGDHVTGSATGATGIIAYDDPNRSCLYIHDVIGSFSSNDAISCIGKGNFAITDSQNTGVVNFNYEQAGLITQEPTAGGSTQYFFGDIKKDLEFSLRGQLTFTANSATVTGIETLFASQLRVGDVIRRLGTGELVTVSAITSDTSMTVRNTGGAISGSNTQTSFTGESCTRLRSQIHRPQQAVSIFAYERDFISEHTCDLIHIKKQTVQTIGSGEVTIAQQDGAFEDQNTDNFSIAVVDISGASNPTFSKGDLLDIESYKDANPATNGSGQSITLGDFGSANDGVVLRITYSVLVTTPNRKSKTLHKGRALKITGKRSAGYSGVYTSAMDDQEITLGVADVFKIRGIYDGVDSAPITPSATLQEDLVTFSALQLHEEIKGQTSDARAIIIDYNAGATTYFYYLTKKRFVEGEIAVGQNNKSQVTIDSLSAGSKEITESFLFDDGQKDGYYGISKLIRKQGRAAPIGEVLVVFDYFSHGAGEFFDVNSYSVPYKDIPIYSANRVDLGGNEPDGTFELSDCLDYRPVAGQLYDKDLTQTVDLTNISSISSIIEYAHFSYEDGVSFKSSRDKKETNTGFNYSTNPAIMPTPKDASAIQGDLKFYVPRIDKLFLHKSGQFQIASGIAGITPTRPPHVDGAIEIAELKIPAFTKDPKEITVKTKDHRRFTMRDIGRISQRVTALETVTTLSLLEADTRSTQILDADGFDKFKSGFLVDNFRNQRASDVLNTDYNAAIDIKMGQLRPSHVSQSFPMEVEAGSLVHTQQTGDFLTLPYTERKASDTAFTSMFVTQASRSINVNPFLVTSFTGTCNLSPDMDTRPGTPSSITRTSQTVSNFNAIQAELRGLRRNGTGTLWNDWETTWTGTPVTTSEPMISTSGSWSGSAEQGGEWQPGIDLTREITETPEVQVRNGMMFDFATDVSVDERNRVRNIQLERFMKQRTITVTCQGLKPNTYHYVYFDSVDVSPHMRSERWTYGGSTYYYSPSHTSGSLGTRGAQLQTDANGRLKARFYLPPNTFTSGTKELIVTSQKYNSPNPVSSATALYTSTGMVANIDRHTTTTRTSRITRVPTSDAKVITTRGETINATFNESEPGPNPFTELDDRIDDLQTQIDEIGAEDPVGPGDGPLISDDDPNWPPTLPPGFPPIDIGDFRFDAGMFPTGIWFDPVAQSFAAPESVGTNMVLTSIDLYFKTKDVNKDITVELRGMENGYPTQTPIPLSVVTKTPDEINVSEDASAVTKFTFSDPIIIKSQMEYCFVVYTSSDQYEIWYAHAGDKDIANGVEVAVAASNMGSMFVSQNSSTWTARQEDDIKYCLNYAEFDIAQSSSFNLTNADIPWYNADETIDINSTDEDDVENHIPENPISTVADSSSITMQSFFHGHYNTSSNVQINGVIGDRNGGVYRISDATDSGTLPVDGTYNLIHGTLPYNTGTSSTLGSDNVSISAVKADTTPSDGNTTGTGVAFRITVSTSNGVSDITACKVLQAGDNFAVGDVITVTVGSSWSFTTTVEGIGQTLGGIPVRAINTSIDDSHTSIGADFTIDTFSFTPNLSATAVQSDIDVNSDITTIGQALFPDYVSDYKATDTTVGGGRNVVTSKNIYYDGIHTQVQNILCANTGMFINAVGTPMNSPEGYIDGTVYQRRISGDNVTLNENAFFSRPSIIASRINEKNEMSSGRSLQLKCMMFSRNQYISPFVDTQTLGGIAFANRINGLQKNSNDNSFSSSINISQESLGEDNAFCYVTKKINLKNPATGIRVMFDCMKNAGTDVKVLFKTVKVDDERKFDEIGYEFFNTDGSPDTPIGADGRNFKEYEYNVEDLPEFSSFIIKIVGQGYNTSKPPLISAFRAIATG